MLLYLKKWVYLIIFPFLIFTKHLKTSESFKSTLYEYLIQACSNSLETTNFDSELIDEVLAVENSLEKLDSASLSRFPIDLSFLVQQIRALCCAAILKNGILRPASEHLTASMLSALSSISQTNPSFDKNRILSQLRQLKLEVQNVRSCIFYEK